MFKRNFRALCESIGGLSFGEVYRMTTEMAEERGQFGDALKLSEKIYEDCPKGTNSGTLMAACLILFVFEITGGTEGAAERKKFTESIRN